MVVEIRELESLVKSKLKGRKIAKTLVKSLTKAGENYGSLMLSVDLTLQDDTRLHFVAKMVPPNEFVQKMFNSPETFRKEIALFETIVPTLQQLVDEVGTDLVVDFAPELIGSRTSLQKNSNKVDMDSAIIMENLKIRNFTTADRHQGLNFEETKLVLRELAQLHGISLALKLRKPEVFESRFKPFLKVHDFGEALGSEQKGNFANNTLSTIQGIPEIVQYTKRAEKVLLTTPEYKIREPWATIVHNDCWVNNCMLRYDEITKKTRECKLVDYQVIIYGSPAMDVLFFLFSSTRNDLIREKFDELIRYYHERVLQVLKSLKADKNVDEKFSFKSFEEELRIEATASQFSHVCWMLVPIFLESEHAIDVLNMSEEHMNIFQEPTQNHKDKLSLVVEEFAKRNWI